MPFVQSVFYLGAIPGQPGKMFLLVLTADSEINLAAALSSTIRESCRQVADVTALVHYASALFNRVRENNLFLMLYGTALPLNCSKKNTAAGDIRSVGTPPYGYYYALLAR